MKKSARNLRKIGSGISNSSKQSPKDRKNRIEDDKKMSAKNKFQIIFEVLKSEANDLALVCKKHPLSDKTKIESKSWA